MSRKLLLSSLILVSVFTAGAFTSSAFQKNDGHEADRQAIRAHIDKIFRAYVDKDCATIRGTHANDWIGFTGQARSILHGIDQYMNSSARFCQGNAPNFDWNITGLADYKITEIDFYFSGDLALVPYVADVVYGRTTRTPGKLRSLDVYSKQNGEWNQIASNIYPHPDMVQAQIEQALGPRALSPAERQALLTAREAVWRAFFTNDQAQLDKLVPDDTIVLGGVPERPFVKKAEILASAKQSAQRGKLVRLEFPQTELQVFGNTAIIYTTYLYELENAEGERRASKGSATEIFTLRNGMWVNPGWHLDNQ